MRVRPLPKSWLIHTIVYEGYAEKDDLQNPIYDNPVAIEFVRHDPMTVFSRDSLQTKIIANGVIFVDAVNSTPIPDFKEESRITFKGDVMTLKKVVPCYQPKSDEIRHWELEVI